MTDPFELLLKGDVAGLAAELAARPDAASAQHPSGASLLAFTCYAGNPEATRLVRTLVALPDPWEAIILGEPEPLAAALGDGWDANALSPDGFPPLALAAFFGNTAAFDVLLPLTTDIDRRAENPQHVAALHAAVSARQAKMVEQLLTAGASPDLTQQQGVTPLHAAAHHGDTAIAGLLLLAGADPALRDEAGRSAIDHAKAGGHEWLAKRLAAYAASDMHVT